MTKTAEKQPQASTPRAERHPTQRPGSHATVTADVIDRVHHSRMTLGDRELEAEVLRLFDRQCAMLLQCMRDTSAESAAAFAHAKGSCRGVGAWHMAQAAEQVEAAAHAGDRDGFDTSLHQLADAVAHTRAAISHLLNT
jgi:hypothetical protein